jgi:hypothetical protein
VNRGNLQYRDQVVCESLTAILCLLAFLFGAATRSDGFEFDASSSKTKSSAQVKEVTYRGCLFFGQQNQAFSLVTGEDLTYDLVGNVDELPDHPDGLPVSLSGFELKPAASEDEVGRLDVRHAKVLNPIAELHKSVTDSSRWTRKADRTYGVRFAVPKEASLRAENPLTPSDLPSNSVRIFDSVFPVYPNGGTDSGQLLIYVSTGETEKYTYAVVAQRDSAHRRGMGMP